jgi:murein L,D-transpeptidase YcbB/YkuD
MSSTLRVSVGRVLLSSVALALAVPSAAIAQAGSSEIQAAMRAEAGGGDEIRSFYRSRGYAPLWTGSMGVKPEAEQLVEILGRADLDGLSPKKYRVKDLASALRKAGGGSPKALARAECCCRAASSPMSGTSGACRCPAWSMSIARSPPGRRAPRRS